LIKNIEKLNKKKVTVIIPAFNEGDRIGYVMDEVTPYADEVIVVDDGSSDDTAMLAKEKGAVVLENKGSKGYIGAIKKGFEAARNDVVVTMDADGEHDPIFISDLTEPIFSNEADLVLGARKKIDRMGERIITSLVRLVVDVSDSGTGMRAMRSDLARRLDLKGKCICGISVLEPFYLGSRIKEVPIENRTIDKPRKIAWGHFQQFFIVLSFMLKMERSKAQSINRS